MQANSANKLINDFIYKHGINKAVLAKKMEMPQSTFKLKLSDNYPQYRFNNSKKEIERLKRILIEFSNEAIDLVTELSQ